MTKLINIKNLTVAYDNLVALSNVNFTVNKGDFIGVIGPNGGGKTTLIRSAMKLIKPQSGTVEYVVDGLRIGYLPQQTTIDKQFPATVLDVICSGVVAPRKNVRPTADRLLEELSIVHLRDRLISELSGGEFQRVLLARALVCDPQVLILDEPTTYVDSTFEHDFYHIIHKLNDKMAIVMVSHDLGTITHHVKTIACVNGSLHYHPSNIITSEQLSAYECPLQLVTHGQVPHTVLLNHTNAIEHIHNGNCNHKH